MNIRKLFVNLVLTGAFSLCAAEYFVMGGGSDSATGMSESDAFATIQHGVTVLKPGDVLTILPGKYHEAVCWEFDGSADVKTVVRAQYPGTVLLHGDTALPNFAAVSGRANCHQAELPTPPEAILELDTLKTYDNCSSFTEGIGDTNIGSFRYDDSRHLLQINPFDVLAFVHHTITVSDIPRCGFKVMPASDNGTVQNIEIDGLCVRGFNSRVMHGNDSIWGIFITSPVNCTIRRCTAYLNAGGIGMRHARNSRIEHCQAYANGNLRNVSAGNIIMQIAADSVIDHCLSFRSATYGIRFYGNNKNNIISNCLSLGDVRGSIWIKPPDPNSKLVNSYTPDMVAVGKSETSVFRSDDYDPDLKKSPTSLQLGKNNNVMAYPRDFADPWNFDLRLQEKSQFKCGFAGSDVFFLSPEGDDSNSGRSIVSPWKTLTKVPDGATVYLLPGKYDGGMTLTANDVLLAGRGQHGAAVIGGGQTGLTISGNNARLLRLSFVGQLGSAISAQGAVLAIENCGFADSPRVLDSSQALELLFRHTAVASSVKTLLSGERIKGVISHNILASAQDWPTGIVSINNAYSTMPPAHEIAAVMLSPDFKDARQGDFTLVNEHQFYGKSLDGLPLGPYFFLYEPISEKPQQVQALKVNDTTATIRFVLRQTPTFATVQYREQNAAQWIQVRDQTVECHCHDVSLAELKPNTNYEYIVTIKPRLAFNIANHFQPAKFAVPESAVWNSDIGRFATLAQANSAIVYHVSQQGSDDNDGSTERPFRSISRGAEMAGPGDTVLVHQGTYTGTVIVPNEGTAEKKILFKAAENESVWLDGVSQQSCRAFSMFGKKHVQFDGFHFKMYGTEKANSSGIYLIFACEDIAVQRSFHDGRAGGYSPAFVHARFSKQINIRNSVSVSGMQSLAFVESDAVNIEHCVFKMPAIYTMCFYGTGDKKVRFTHNIVTDNLKGKTGQELLQLGDIASLTERNNLYYLRYPRHLREIISCVQNNQREKFTLDEYYQLVKHNGGSICTNPGFKAAPEMMVWENEQLRQADLAKPIEFQRMWNDKENARYPGNSLRFKVWDFHDFLPTSPESINSTAGLQRDAFKFPATNEELWEQRN